MPKMQDTMNITGYYRESIRPHDGPEFDTLADGMDDLISELISPRKRTRWPIRNTEPREPASPAKRAIIYQRDGETCWYCWTGGGGPLQLDHIIPRTAFPPHQLHIADRSDNLVTACTSCNEAKSNYESSNIKRPGVVLACWYCQNPWYDDEKYADLRGQDYANLPEPPEMDYIAYCGRHGNTTWVPEIEGWIL